MIQISSKSKLPIFWLKALIIIAGIAVYYNSFSGVFLFDDSHSIVQNKAIRSLWPPWEAMFSPTGGKISSRPITNYSFAINYALGGLNVWGYHLVNLAIHILAALTLFSIIRRTLLCERLRAEYEKTAPWAAFAISLLWIVHPLLTQSVTYIVQRAESLAGLFYLLVLYFAARGFQSPRPRAWYTLAVLSCVLGLGSKEVMVTAPIMALLVSRIFYTNSFRESFQKQRGLFIGLFSVLMLWLPLAALSSETTAGPAFRGITPIHYALTQPGVILHYIRLSFWSHPLIIDYDWPVVTRWEAALVPGFILMFFLAATFFALKRRPKFGFLGAWFFLTLAPSSSFFPIADPAFEHRMYLPLAGIIALTVFACEYGLRRFLLQSRIRLGLGGGLFIIAAILLSVLTVRRNQDYHDVETMWLDAAEKRPNNPRVQDNLGFMLTKEGRYEEARQHFLEAARLNPSFPGYRNSVGITFARQGEYNEAIKSYMDALHVDPDYGIAHINLGRAYTKLGIFDKATDHLGRAIEIDPDSSEAYFELGSVLADQGRLDEAMPYLSEAIRLNPGYVEAYTRKGLIFYEQQRYSEAVKAYQEALRIDPNYAIAHNNAGAALANLGRFGEALDHYREALRLNPGDESAKRNMEIVLRAQGKEP